MIKYGLVCISEILRDQNPELKFKTLQRRTFNSLPRNEAIKELSRRIIHNLRVTEETIRHCSRIGISHYRLSSSLFPLITDPTLHLSLQELDNYTTIVAKLAQIGATAKHFSISLSLHPDQFVVLASKNADVRNKSISELNFLAEIMDLIGCPKDHSSPINIHPSLSSFDSLDQFMNNFIHSFFSCSSSVRSRLVLENEDHGYWNAENLYDSFHKNFLNSHGVSIPLTLDNLHDKCNPSLASYKELYIKYYQTWPQIPVFHWSEGIGDSAAHANVLSCPPPDYGLDCIYECEVKSKDKGFSQYLKYVPN